MPGYFKTKAIEKEKGKLQEVLPQDDPESFWIWEYLGKDDPYSIEKSQLIRHLIELGCPTHAVALAIRKHGLYAGITAVWRDMQILNS